MKKRPLYGPWPTHPTRRLANGVGYLRLTEMTRETATLREAMERFRDTIGLINKDRLAIAKPMSFTRAIITSDPEGNHRVVLGFRAAVPGG